MLNAKQKRFAAEYIIDCNATQAAIRAGYSKKTAGQQGFDLLKNPEIARTIEEQEQKRAIRTEVTQDEVIADLREVRDRCMQRQPVMVYDREAKCKVQATNERGEGIWQFDSNGACKSIELLGKSRGMFRDVVEMNNKMENVIYLPQKLPEGAPVPGAENNEKQGDA